MTTQRRAMPGMAATCLANSCVALCGSIVWLVTITGLASTVAGARDTPQPLRSEFLMELSADLEQPSQELGDTPLGTRHIVYVLGGSFSGPKIKGEVMRGGGDWYLVRHDGAAQLDVRITLRTDDGALIFVSYRAFPTSRRRCGSGSQSEKLLTRLNITFAPRRFLRRPPQNTLG